MRACLTFLILLFSSHALAEDQKYTGEYATCDSGLKGCDYLRNNLQDYWGCMQRTCNTKQLPNCEKGHKSCRWVAIALNKCKAKHCPIEPDGKLIDCAEGKQQCEGGAKQYWECVTHICTPPYDMSLEENKTKLYYYEVSNGNHFKEMFKPPIKPYHLDKDGNKVIIEDKKDE